MGKTKRKSEEQKKREERVPMSDWEVELEPITPEIRWRAERNALREENKKLKEKIWSLTGQSKGHLEELQGIKAAIKELKYALEGYIADGKECKQRRTAAWNNRRDRGTDPIVEWKDERKIAVARNKGKEKDSWSSSSEESITSSSEEESDADNGEWRKETKSKQKKRQENLLETRGLDLLRKDVEEMVTCLEKQNREREEKKRTATRAAARNNRMTWYETSSEDDEVREEPIPMQVELVKKEKAPLSIVLRHKEKWNHVKRELAAKKVGVLKTRDEADGIRIFPATPADYIKVTACLNHFRYDHHTYTLEEDERQCIVLKGLSEQTDIVEIHNELRDRGFDVKETSRMFSSITGRPLPMVLLKCGQEERDIWKISHVLNQKVWTERHRKPGQCLKCQKYGHRANECQEWKETSAIYPNCGAPQTASYSGCVSPSYRKPAARNPTRTEQSYTAVTQNTQAQPWNTEASTMTFEIISQMFAICAEMARRLAAYQETA